MGTLDEIFLYCKELGEEDYKILLAKLREEENNREHRRQKEAWAKVCEAIAHYTANFGNIRVADCCGDDENVICLHHGQYTFSEYGDIEVGA